MNGICYARRPRATVARSHRFTTATSTRSTVVLRYLEGRSTKEPATVIGKPESTIRGIQMRALAALRELLGDLPL